MTIGSVAGGYFDWSFIGIGAIGALVVGLVVAAPICFVGAAIMLAAVHRNPVWASTWRWITVGTAAGPVVPVSLSLLLVPIDEQIWAAWLVAGLAGGALGGLGGFLCRYFSRKHISALDSVDLEIFA